MNFNTKESLHSSLKSSILILKLIVPLYILSDILLYLGWLDKISFLFEPIASLIGLPAQTALSLAAGVFINIYAAIALAAPLGLSPYEWTIMGLFLGVCHSLIVESAIIKKLGISYIYSFALRFSMGFVAVFPIKYLPKDWFVSESLKNTIKQIRYEDFWQMLTHSFIGSLELSFKIILLVSFIIILMDWLKSTSLIKSYSQKVSASFSILAGLILGITYGAGVLIKEAKSGNLSRKEILFIATFLMICHSVIEDTLLFVIFGANLWVLISFRLILASVVSFLALMLFSPPKKHKTG